MTMIQGDTISNLQFLARLKALELETKGFKPRGRGMLGVCNDSYGYNATRKKTLLVLMQADWLHFKETGEVKWQNIQ